MCGRIVQSSSPADLAIVPGIFASENYGNHPPRWNVAPSQYFRVIRRDEKAGDISFQPLKWGLIPLWTKDDKGGRKSINAKAETVAILPSFRSAYKRRRCIVPVDGYYECAMVEVGFKQPYAIAMQNRKPFGVAGIWEKWMGKQDEWLETFAIITSQPITHGAVSRPYANDFKGK